MIADSAEIKFECSQCGQSIAVDSSGAGLHTNCPTCENPLVIPEVSSLHGRSYGDDAPAADRAAFAGEDAAIAAAELLDLRDELTEARRRGDDAERENARLQQQLKKAREDGERVAAAEAETAGLHAALAQGGQHAAAVETQLAEARAVIAQLGAKLEAVEENRTQWEQAFAQTAEQAHSYETQMTAREADLNTALAAARAEVGTLTDERAALRQEHDDAHAAFRATAAAAEEKLAATQRALESAEAEHRALADRHAALRVEAATLRSDLSEIHTGRELLALRDRFNTLDTDHQRATAALARSTAEAQALTAAAEKLRADFAEARERAAAAEHRADAASESALKQDNEVLRGIIERQNTVGEERYIELRRLRRQRLTLRLLYACITLAVLGCVALAIDYLPAAVQQFLHEWFGL